MKSYFKTILSLFVVLWGSALNAQLILDEQCTELREKMFSFKEQNNYDSTIFYWAEVNHLLLNKNKKEYDLLTKNDLFWLSNHFQKDLKTLEVALDLHKEFSAGIYDSNSTGFWRISKYLSNYMLRFENLDKALIFLNAYKKSKYYTKGSQNQVDYFTAQVLIKMGGNDAAFELMDAFLKEAKEVNLEKQGLISVYNQYGLICIKAEEFEKAIPYFDKAIYEIDSLNTRGGLRPVLKGNIGFCYYKLKQYVKAYDMLEQDVKGSMENGEYRSYFYAEITMARIDFIEKRKEDALRKTKFLLNNDFYTLNFSQKKECYNFLLEIYESQNDLINAFKLFKSIKINNDSIVSSNRRDYNNYNVLNSNLIFEQVKNNMAEEVSKREREKTHLMKELELKDRNNLYLVLILLLIILSSFMFFRKIILEKKQSGLIREQEKEIVDQKLKIEFEQRSLLEIKIKQRNNRINHQLLELESKKFAAEKIIENLKINTSLSTVELAAAKIFVNNELEVKSISDQVHSFIDDIGVDYVENVKRAHDNLTDKEIRLSVMVSLKLSNKEIGISQNLTTATVKNNKNRLKKKLNLTGEESLVDYLSQFI